MVYCICMSVILIVLKVSNSLNWEWVWIMSPILLYLGLETLLDIVSRFIRSCQPKPLIDQLKELSSMASKSTSKETPTK